MTESVKNTRKHKMSTNRLVTMAMCTAILCIAAYISIPIPIPGSPHITMQNFMVLLIALLFPLKQAFMIVLVWMLLGVIGLPVFVAGMSGIGYLTSAWGGYTVAFLVVAVLLPLMKGKKYLRTAYTVIAIIGVCVVNLIGMIWLKYMGIDGYDSWKAVFFSGFVVFLPMDLLKAVIVAQIIPAFQRVLSNV